MEQWVHSLSESAALSLRPVDGSVTIPGLANRVEVITDRWGVPHVYASGLDDLYAAQGWLHATERLWQVDFTRRLAQGRLAELVGEPGLPSDRFFRTIGILRAARKHARAIDAQSRRILEAYHRGFLAGARSVQPIEYRALSAEPYAPESVGDLTLDSNALALLLCFVLSTNWPFELLRAQLAERLGPEAARELTPFAGAEAPLAVPQAPGFPGTVRDLVLAATRAGLAPGLGSNNWVVSGAKSVAGSPLLANDPHLLAQMPAIWYEVHLSCPDLEVAGASLPGVPGVLIGHNDRIAWGFTNSQADVEDLYLERLSPDGTRHLFRNAWRPVRTIRERISVRGEKAPRVHEVRVTRHGPLITDTIVGVSDPQVRANAIAAPLALRWIHYDVIPTVAQVQAINRARDWGTFREAIREWGGPGQNAVYADVDGNIGYQLCGVIPIRERGSGAAPLPGWSGDHEWRGTVPFDALPSVVNPPQGFLATANHRIVDLDFPYYITNDWEPGYRVRRIVRMLTEKEKLSREDFARIQADVHSGIADDLVPHLLTARAQSSGAIGALKEVEAWDRRLDAESVGGAIFNVWLFEISSALFRRKLGDDLHDAYHALKSWTTAWAYDAVRDILRNPRASWVGGDGTDNVAARDELLGRALEAACERLEARFGPDPSEWRWGRLHPIHFRHPIGRAVPALDPLLSTGPFEAPGGDDTINRGVFAPGEDYACGAIASYRQIIDLSDFDRSLAIITVGQSGNPASPHHHDQSEPWLRGEYHQMAWSRGAVEREAEGRLLLEPGD